MPRFGQFLVDAVNFRPTWSMVQSSRKLREFLFGPDGVYFDAAVVEIARETGEPELAGGTLGKVAEADALDAAADQPATRGLWMRRHGAGQVGDLPHWLCDYGV